MTDLHARLDVLEGDLDAPLIGGAAGQTRRAFAVLALMRGDGTIGVGEASPLPGYSPDSLEEVEEELRGLVDSPVGADPLGSPFDVLTEALAAHPVQGPAARFAIETALLDWLGQERRAPLHRILAGDPHRRSIPIVDLVLDRDPSIWPARVDALVDEGATHVKIKISADLEHELPSIEAVRRAHPTLPLRLDGNRRVSIDALRRHANALETLQPELVEEPVPVEAWLDALELPLPFALDESLRDSALRQRLLDTGRIRAVVLKPMVLGGFQASFAVAEQAADRGADSLVSHTFDGPFARAASAELALALQTPRAAGLGLHPALDLWTPHRIAAIDGRTIVTHDAPGLGLRFEDGSYE